MDIYSDVSKLETHSRRNALTREEVIWCLNKSYVNQEEASALLTTKLGVFTWDQLRKKYEDWSRAHCRKTTHDVNMLRLGKVIEYVEGKEPEEYRAEDIKLFIQKRKAASAKDWTVRHEQGVLRKLFDFMDGDNPAREVPLVQAKDEIIPRAFSRIELTKIMKLVKGKKKHLYGYLRPIVLTYLYAGLRPSEIVRLTPVDVQANKLLIQGETKTGRPGAWLSTPSSQFT